mmetsp:Transcript_61302/g.91018  ORF Transcript_61302/g.91018 Transcript_61302/m.91018 type:complete len:489 (-) Transcript_61302:987-2453(-)
MTSMPVRLSIIFACIFTAAATTTHTTSRITTATTAHKNIRNAAFCHNYKKGEIYSNIKREQNAFFSWCDIGVAATTPSRILSPTFSSSFHFSKNIADDDDESYDKAKVASPWYSDPSLKRDRSKILLSPNESAASPKSRFVLFHGSNGVIYTKQGEDVDPLLFNYEELIKILGEKTMDAILSSSEKGGGDGDDGTVLAWLGNRNEIDYWALYLTENGNNIIPSEQVLSSIRQLLESKNDAGTSVQISPVREIGDVLQSVNDAALLSTANGLIEFHKAHPFCSKCGSRTTPSKAGASRRCSNDKCTAKSTYPRIDVASIMLVTSPCENYALLGRKSFWPKGRYSTLSGFAEVGETLEECCIRETYEESGVIVDPTSVRFVLSQPWPFPRSLMVGFRAKAVDVVATKDDDVMDDNSKGENTSKRGALPVINRCEEEMEDVAWFHRDYVAPRIETGGSTALTFEPSEEEAEFHIPGKASLASILISMWANE